MAANESIVLGTDMPTPLELNSNTGPLVLDDVAWGIPKKKPHWIEGPQDAVLVDDEMGYENAETTASVRVEPQASFDLSRAKHADLVQMLQEAELRGSDGLPCSYTPAEGTTTWLWYLRLGEVDELPITHESGYFARSPVLKIRMVRKPALYASAETTGPTVTASLPVITLEVPSVPGDLPAETRVVLTDMVTAPGQSRRFVEIGLENRHYDESKAANGGTAPPLVLDSDSLVTSGFAGAGTTRTGAYDPGAAGNSVIRATLTGSPVAVCGTGDQKHIGTFRVRGRVWASSSSVRARFAWQDGDGPFRANPYATPAVVGAFARVDLGLITIEKAALGTQRWAGRVEAYGDAGDTIDVDDLELIPAGEGYSTSRVVRLFETATAFSARDEFAQTAGNLNGKTAPVGGNWATSGVATDFAVSGSGTVTRATISEGAADRRYAVLDVNLTAIAVEADLSVSAVPGSSLSMGLIARWTDANNHLRIERDVQSGTPSLNIFKVVGGVVTELWSFELAIGAPIAGTAWSMRALVDASGRVAAWIDGILVAQAQDAVLATGGTLASGDVGIIDVFTASPAVTRTYDNFLAFVPAADETIFATRSMQLRPDGAKRVNAAATLWGGIQTHRGTPAGDFRLPPAGAKGRTSRIAVAVRRHDSETMVDDGLTDSTKVEVFYRQRVLVPR